MTGGPGSGGDQDMRAEAFHPSEYIRDEMAARGWDTAWLARTMGISLVEAEPIVQGQQRIDGDVAYMLGAAFGTSRELWLNLQASYNERVQQ